MNAEKTIKDPKTIAAILDSKMKRAKDFRNLWSKIKSESRHPTFVKLRLTDEAKFMGTLVLVDLLNPTSPLENSPGGNLHRSFSQLSCVSILKEA
ncbi:hypothetical protein DFQ28_003179 [Apophysomyces sp. BC1034]|nr:hypothetical protein DFQ30_003911 [Apophysomyces sp. BC1015]KAG0179213.1 hypothetical protein DFQ29_002406 [Apophysomyces sp. BC1021]KAG0189608.1 hypothetical protein DFQ28_003179 [Apophysomyces sp. BC1034]